VNENSVFLFDLFEIVDPDTAYGGHGKTTFIL